MAANWVNILVRAFGGGAPRKVKIPKATEVVNVAGMSTWVGKVSWTPLTQHIGLIKFKPKKGKWYTVPNQTYDTFLELTKAGLVPGDGTGTQLWIAKILGGLGNVRKRAKESGIYKAGFTQKASIRKLADAFRQGDKKGQEALGRYVAQFGKSSIPLATRFLSALRSASKIARLRS